MLVLLIVTVVPVLAQAVTPEAAQKYRLKDVPDDHWAAGAVYDLVNLGVTKGYPDGTYRGNKPITRFETAIFLSKLAKALDGEDLKTELKAVRDQIAEIKSAPKESLRVSGGYEGIWKVGNILSSATANRGGVASYRLVATAAREFSDSADIKINLDTMDYGYLDDGSTGQTGRGMLAADLLDMESNLKLDLASLRLTNPVNLKLTYGPGPKQHQTDPTGILPSEVGVVYWRPETGISLSTSLLGATVTGGYYSLQGRTLEVDGRINNSWVNGSVSYVFERLNSLKVELAGDYISKGLMSADDRTIKARVGLLAPLGKKAEAETTVALGHAPSRMMVAGRLSLNDPWDTGTVMTVRAAKVGSEYINDRIADSRLYDLAGYDYFERPLENGTVNIGGELVQQVSDRAKLIGKGDLRLSGDYKYEGAKARLTAQGSILYNVAPNVNLETAYRVYQDKSLNDTSDLAAFGLQYRF